MNPCPDIHARRSRGNRRAGLLKLRRIGLSLGLMAAVAIAGNPVAAQNGVRLPNMGEPAEQSLSLREEIRIGKAFMRMVRAQLDVVQDPLIQTYVSGLGERLARSSTGAETGFTFFVVDDPTINAFAAPGGYVGIHTGLILAVENEAQLAAVMAHEIAHVTQRHLARAFSSAERSALPTVAGIIAAILLGATNPQASQAALATSIAANAQQQINYTRSNEQEADRVGITFLTEAGYDPAGMPEVFDILRRANSLGGSRAPAYLSTHPLSEARIAEARDRAIRLRESNQIRDDVVFQQIKIRTAVLGDGHPSRLSAELHERASTQTGSQREMLLYGAVVAALQTRDLDAARPALDELLRIRPTDLAYRLADASWRYRSGDQEQGRKIFAELLQIYPQNFPVLARFAGLLTDTGAEQEAADLLKSYVRSIDKPEPLAYRLLAAALEKQALRLLSLEALAEYHYLLGEIGIAIQNLRTASKLAPPGSEDSLRISARLDHLTKMASDALQQNN